MLYNSMPIPLTQGSASIRPEEFKEPHMEKMDVTSTTGMSAGMDLPMSDAAHLLRDLTPASSFPRTPPVATHNGVKMHKGVDKMTHQANENRTGASREATSQWLGEILSANGIERSEERSDAITGPAVEQALALFSAKVEERRQVPSDAIVKMQNRAKENIDAPSQLAAFTLPATAHTAPSFSSKCAIPNAQPSDAPMPHIVVISRQRDLSIVSKTSGENSICSQGLQTTERQSYSSLAGARSNGGEQLMRAAAYIQECLTRCSSTCNEFISRTPKDQPDKKAEPDSQQHVISVISKNEKANVSSPEPLMESTLLLCSVSKAVPVQPEALRLKHKMPDDSIRDCGPTWSHMPLAALPAFSLQAHSFSKLGNELVWFHLKPPDYGGPKRYPCDTVSSLLDSSVKQHSPVLLKTGLPPVSKPDDVWADDTSRPSSPELVWWECAKPPNTAAC